MVRAGPRGRGRASAAPPGSQRVISVAGDDGQQPFEDQPPQQDGGHGDGAVSRQRAEPGGQLDGERLPAHTSAPKEPTGRPSARRLTAPTATADAVPARRDQRAVRGGDHRLAVKTRPRWGACSNVVRMVWCWNSPAVASTATITARNQSLAGAVARSADVTVSPIGGDAYPCEADEPRAERGEKKCDARKHQGAQLECLGVDDVSHDGEPFEVRSRNRSSSVLDRWVSRRSDIGPWTTRRPWSMTMTSSTVWASSASRWLDARTVRPSSQECAQPQHAGGVQAVGRLVQHDGLRVTEQRRGEPQPLAHPHRVAPDPARAASARPTSSSTSSARRSGMPEARPSTCRSRPSGADGRRRGRSWRR